MNIYKSLNEIINYIEDHLEEKIDYKKLAKYVSIIMKKKFVGLIMTLMKKFMMIRLKN
ncbi:MAG: hypothetical protein IJA94_00455 [Bacilli bacterium]|nr:hypothetical protein [Bacilli bacterium]